MIYQCDHTLSNGFRCSNAANYVLDTGKEMHQFCVWHVPADRSEYIAEYGIENDSLVETGISKHNRAAQSAECPVIAPESIPRLLSRLEASDLRDLAKSAIERHHDRIRAHALGVKL